jgi:hypothetical protein
MIGKLPKRARSARVGRPRPRIWEGPKIKKEAWFMKEDQKKVDMRRRRIRRRGKNIHHQKPLIQLCSSRGCEVSTFSVGKIELIN